MIYENKSIETHSLCVAMVLLCREEEREREKKKKREWQCSLLVEGKVLYEKSRFHRLMLLMIMTFSREKKDRIIFLYSSIFLLLILSLKIEDYDHQQYILIHIHKHHFQEFQLNDLKIKTIFCKKKKHNLQVE